MKDIMLNKVAKWLEHRAFNTRCPGCRRRAKKWAAQFRNGSKFLKNKSR